MAATSAPEPHQLADRERTVLARSRTTSPALILASRATWIATVPRGSQPGHRSRSFEAHGLVAARLVLIIAATLIPASWSAAGTRHLAVHTDLLVIDTSPS